MHGEIEAFLEHIVREKHASANTITSYRRDLGSFVGYLSDSGIASFSEVTSAHIDAYLRYLESMGKKETTISRCTSSIHSFYRFLCLSGMLSADPSRLIRTVAPKHTLPNVLTSKEVDLLLSQAAGNTEKEIRDRAMLELMYATGLRVSELVNLNLSDLNYEIGFVRAQGDRRERVIPLYPKACALLKEYCKRIRPLLCYNTAESALFLNLSGQRLSRQGFWKIVKGYAESAGIAKSITPQTLRHSFALHLLENGADIHMISSMLGHADVSSTQIYNEIIRQKISNPCTKYHPHAAKQ